MHKFGKLALAGVSLLAFGTPALAQDAVSASHGAGFDSGEIVVQARRRDESVQDVPSVVNAVTSEAIDKLNIRKLDEVTAVVPGLALQPNANGAGAVATVRGVNFDANVSGQNGTIEFYLNDTPISGTVLMQAMYDIGQLEVLRGPQGTLRGRASPSGSITVSLRKPNLSEVGGNAQATVNDLNGFNINGALNIPIIQDKLAVRVAGLVANDRGNRVRSWRAGDIKPRNDTESGRISVRADPFDGILLLDFTYQAMLRNTRQYEQVESIAGMPSNAPNPTIRARQRLGSGAMPFTTRQEIDNYTWQAQLSLFDQKLVYVGSSSKLNNLGTETADKAGIFGSQTFDGPIVVSGFRPAENFDLYPDRVTANGPISRMTRSIATSESHEVRLQNETRIFDMFDYVIGAMQYSFETPSYLLVPNLVGVVNTASTPKTANLLTIADGYSLRYGHAKEQSLFGNLTARPVEGLEISGGLRRIWYKGLTGLVSYNGSADGMDVLPYRNKIDEAATIYTGAIKYNVTPDLMVYASTGSSWRAPTAVIGGPIIPDANQARFLKLPAETSKSYEVGFKSDWLDRRLRLNVTAYHQKFKNYQYRMPGNGVFGFDRLRNAVIPFNYAAPVPVKVYGMEAELSYQILPNWSIGGLVTYTDGKISKGANLPCADVNGDGVADTTVPDRSVFLDGTVPYVGVCPATKSLRSSTASPWAASIQSEYAHRINDGMDAYLRGLFSWKGHSQNDPVNPHDSIKSYGLLNLYAGLRDVDGGWELSAYAKNLTNAYRVTSRTLFPLATALAAGTPGNYNYTNYYGIESTAPREFGINFRMAFGSR